MVNVIFNMKYICHFQQPIQPGNSTSENCAVFLVLDEVMAYIHSYESQTNSHFIQQKKDIGFNRSCTY